MPLSVFSRILTPAPDMATSACFLILWNWPFRFGAHGVRNGVLTMLVEFILMHASACVGVRRRSSAP